MKKFDTIGQITAYENGELNEDEVRELFQELVDSGLAWTLQGSYGRTAHAMIEAGEIRPPVQSGQCEFHPRVESEES